MNLRESTWNGQHGLVYTGIRDIKQREIEILKEHALKLNVNAIEALIDLCRENISQSQPKNWISFFEKLNILTNEWNEFFVRGYVINHMCDDLRSKKLSEKDDRLLANHPILKTYIFNSFVDYETLTSDQYFGRLVRAMDPQTMEEETFKKSLILMGHYLKGDNTNIFKWSEALSRYPLDNNYFPIINSRIWAARFIHEFVKNRHIDSELESEWLDMIKRQKQGEKLFYSMEALPILVKYSKNVDLIEQVFEHLEEELDKDLEFFPIANCVESSMFNASKSAFYKKIGRAEESRQLRQILVQTPCLKSYQGYAFRVASAV